MYWLNIHHTTPLLERALMNGNARRAIVSRDMRRPSKFTKFQDLRKYVFNIFTCYIMCLIASISCKELKRISMTQ